MISLDDLNKIDDVKFEKLIKTALLLVIGKGVTPFSKGKDGAREAIYHGKAEYPSKTEIWSGNWIFQVKFSDISLGIDKARKQIKYTIDSELKKLEDYGYISKSKVDNYILITNVPFSGEAKKGLHDYIAEKRENYKVKNFHYWDGEKIIAIINSHPQIRETFFPPIGFNNIDNKTIEAVKKYFVKPALYQNLRELLIQNRILNIKGQAHVGKTTMSLFLASDIYEDKKLSNIILVPLIDELNTIPKVTNSIIIFDDLYGDVNYDSIGNKTKIINSLRKDNYIIITSRDYIFNDAEKKMETFASYDSNINITQEGAFTNDDLELILKNHLNLRLKLTKRNRITYNFIIKHSSYIISELRYPHNIQLFTTIIDSDTTNKAILNAKIAQAKKIEEVVQSWVLAQEESNKRILLALSIGKIHSLNALTDICNFQWQYKKDDIEKCLSFNSRIVNIKDDIIQFVHPSFKTAIVHLFSTRYKSIFEELVLNLISNPSFHGKKIIYKNLARDIIYKLNTSQLKALILSNSLTKNYYEVCWLCLLKMDKDLAIALILELKKDDRKFSKHFSSIVASKDFMRSNEILGIIKHLLDRRHESKVIEQLIVHFSFGVKPKIREIIKSLDYQNNSRDLKLKIRLLGVIGSEDPDNVLEELESELTNKYTSTRSIVYGAINMLSYKSNKKTTALLEYALTIETHENNILKIKRAIKHRKQFTEKAS